MKKKTIYLHIGTPKTGTTSIQAYLTANELKLHAAGYLVPSSSRLKNDSHICLTNYALDMERKARLRMVCNTNTQKEILKFRKKIHNELRNEICDYIGETVILSDEHCYSKLKNRSELIRLKQLFEGLSDQLKVIIYIREQSEMFCSRYSTSLKNNNRQVISDLDGYSRMRELNYSQVLLMWEAIFGIENIILRIFDREKMYQNNVVSDFCHVLHMPEYDFKPFSRNLSLNAKQCEFLRIINIGFGDIKGKQKIRTRHLLNQMVTNTQIKSPPVTALINETYQDVYNESNMALAVRYYGRNLELFNNKKLSVHSLDQIELLTEADKRNLAMQIIENNQKEHEALCKCIAAIFSVPYQDQMISMDYVDTFQLVEDKKNKFSDFLSRLRNNEYR